MFCRRLQANVQIHGDLLLIPPLNDQFHHFRFARRQSPQPTQSIRFDIVPPSMLGVGGQCFAYRADQYFVVGRLLDKVERARFEGVCANRYIRMSGHYNYGKCELPVDELTLHVEPTHASHANVKYQTSGLRRIVGIQKCLTRAKSLDGEMCRLDKPAQRTSNALVVINDINGCLSRHSLVPDEVAMQCEMLPRRPN